MQIYQPVTRMSIVNTLLKQTKEAHGWANMLINDVAFDKWEIMPGSVESNISWQIGHLIASEHFHSILCVHGKQDELSQKIPFDKYSLYYTLGKSPSESMGVVPPETLKKHFELVQLWTEKLIPRLSEEDLEDSLVPTRIPNPAAKNKYEALSWNIQHVMWHCGQISMLRRLMGEKVNYGL